MDWMFIGKANGNGVTTWAWQKCQGGVVSSRSNRLFACLEDCLNDAVHHGCDRELELTSRRVDEARIQ